MSTNLDKSIRERHIVDISRRKFFVSSCLDSLVRLRDLFPQPLLDFRSPRELPEGRYKLQNEGYRISSHGMGLLVYSQLSTPSRVRRASMSELEG